MWQLCVFQSFLKMSYIFSTFETFESFKLFECLNPENLKTSEFSECLTLFKVLKWPLFHKKSIILNF